MIAFAADVGNQELSDLHLRAILNFAPDFVSSLFDGENKLFQKTEYFA
jgi:hypothetical protein